jgi:hypothetical protein
MSRSEAQISSSVPPTCTVEASRQRGSRPIAAEAPAVAGRQRVAGDAGELLGRGVEEHDARGGQCVEAFDRPARLDPAAEALQVRGQRAADGVGAAPGDGPVLDVSGQREDQPERGGQGLAERQDRMPRAAREEGARPLLAKGQPRQQARRKDRAQAEAQHLERFRGNPQRRQDVGQQRVGVCEEWPHQPRVGGGVASEPLAGAL